MIQEFQVQNFFSIRERQSISFVPTNDGNMRDQYVHEVAEGVELLKIGIVYGSNASGKTTLLNAISYFRSIMLNKPESKNEGMGYFPFLLDKHSRDEHSQMQMTFWLNGEKYVLNLEFDNKRIYEESLIVYTSARPTTLYKREYQPESDHTEVTFGNKAGIDKATQRAIEGNTTNNCTVMAAFGQSNAHVSKLNDVFDFFLTGIQSTLTPRDYLSYDVKNELRNDKDGKKKRFLLQLLKASDFNIVDMTLDEREDQITPDMETAIKGAPAPSSTMISCSAIRVRMENTSCTKGWSLPVRIGSWACRLCCTMCCMRIISSPLTRLKRASTTSYWLTSSSCSWPTARARRSC